MLLPATEVAGYLRAVDPARDGCRARRILVIFTAADGPSVRKNGSTLAHPYARRGMVVATLDYRDGTPREPLTLFL